jgi:hypothetical protein
MRIKILKSTEAREYLQAIAWLRITVFQEWPYLYQGSLEYERTYLENFLRLMAMHSLASAPQFRLWMHLTKFERPLPLPANLPTAFSTLARVCCCQSIAAKD